MAKNIGKLARRYARAFVAVVEKELGNSGSPTPAQSVTRALTEFATVWQNDPELSAGLLSPMFQREDRKRALIAIAQQAKLPEVAVRFLTTLCERERLGSLVEILQASVAAADERAGFVRVEISTASAVAPDEAQEVEASLRRSIEGSPEFHWSVDPSLLGGIVVQFGGKILDGSVSGRLEQLEKSLVR